LPTPSAEQAAARSTVPRVVVRAAWLLMGLAVVAASIGAAVGRPTVESAAARRAPVAAGLATWGVEGSGAPIALDRVAGQAASALGRGATVPPEEARRQARRILDQKRFRHKSTPRPLHGVLRWIGDRLRPITRPIGRAFDSIAANTALAWVAGLVVVAIVVAATAALMARRERARVAASGGAVVGGVAAEPMDPSELERAADAAEGEGRYADAVRLRFQAGLARLARSGRLPAGVVEPNGEISRELASARFDSLALRFDEIVYGDRSATAPDVATARSEWPAVLAETRR
jgi:hypothetical protein